MKQLSAANASADGADGKQRVQTERALVTKKTTSSSSDSEEYSSGNGESEDRASAGGSESPSKDLQKQRSEGSADGTTHVK